MVLLTGDPSLQAKPLLALMLKPIHIGSVELSLYGNRKNTHALVGEKLHMNSAINRLLSQHTERCSGPVSCVRSSDPHRWPCRTRALHAKSSCTLVSF